MFPCTWGFSYAAGSDEVSLPKFMEILGNSYPEMKPRFTFFLLSSFVNLFPARRRSAKKHTEIKTRVNELLIALNFVSSSDVDNLWLELSYRFEDRLADTEVFDLLKRSLESLDNANRNFGIEPHLLTDSEAYVRSLIVKREQMGNQNP